jgi:hypothetical protein
MRRQALTDGTGRWFDLDAAEKFEEATFWDGNNRRSKATNTPWDHEELYRTASGRWVLHWWSQWQGTVDRWEEISEAEAAAWLVRNEWDPEEAGLGEQVRGLEV